MKPAEAKREKIGVAIALSIFIAFTAGAIFFFMPESGGDQVKPAAQEMPRPDPALTEAQRTDLIAKATHGMSLDRDKMESVSFYTLETPNGDWHEQPMRAYLSIPDGHRAIFRIVPRYVGEGWIFIKRIKVMADDQVVYSKEFKYSDVKHEVISGSTVLESADYAADEYDIEAMRKIAAAKSITVRLSGDERRRDYEMPRVEQEQIAGTLKAYDELKPLSNGI